MGLLLPFFWLSAALYRGDSRTRTIDIFVDGVAIKAWTSSGETTGFETIELGVQGTVIDLRGVLTDSDWLSISEVGSAEKSGYFSTRESRRASRYIHERD